MPSSRGSSWPRDRTQVCLYLPQCRQILYPLSHLGNPHRNLTWGFFRLTPSFVNWSLLGSGFYLRPTIPQLFTKTLGVLKQIHKDNSAFLKISRETQPTQHAGSWTYRLVELTVSKSDPITFLPMTLYLCKAWVFRGCCDKKRVLQKN